MAGQGRIRNLEYIEEYDWQEGDINLPMLAWWGEFYDDLECHIIDEQVDDFIGKRYEPLPEKYPLKCHVSGPHLTKEHREQVSRLVNNWNLYFDKIDKKTREYFKKEYEEYELPGVPSEDFYRNIFEPFCVHIFPDSIGIECASILDGEHGFGIRIDDNGVHLGLGDIAFKNHYEYISEEPSEEDKIARLKSMVWSDHKCYTVIFSEQALDHIRDDGHCRYLNYYIEGNAVQPVCSIEALTLRDYFTKRGLRVKITPEPEYNFDDLDLSTSLMMKKRNLEDEHIKALYDYYKSPKYKPVAGNPCPIRNSILFN